ncbi:response regulator transcription factor [Enterococcus sp. HY326]|uniref:response regulator transcription factor n=1 Tax=Enterococcus sp. HY326 TaxID=2971265 RepID=UPI00223F7878|nr:response regulator transcription factor [Enterococcus sp. HY326]
MKKILLVEDDNGINKLLTILLKDTYQVVSAFSGTEGLLLLNQQRFDLVLLDLMLPGLSGEELLEQLPPQQPVIIISAKKEVSDKVKLLKLGADDYITKPFDQAEVLARIEVQLRKSQPVSQNNQLTWRQLTLLKEKHQAFIEEQLLQLTNAEFDILALLMAHPEEVFSKGKIYEAIWQGTYYGDDNTISVHVSNLRKKIAQVTSEEYLKTIWGIGFMLV